MYVLSVIEDEVALHPSEFGPNAHIPAIRRIIEGKYVDRVIPDVGLVVGLYDVLKVTDAYIFPGDLKDSQGDAACTVVFRLMVFRPQVGELLIGRVLASTPMGLQISLGGFFQDVSVPITHLRKPCEYDARSKAWVWKYQASPGVAEVPYPYLQDELICVCVKSVQFIDSLDGSLTAARRAEALSTPVVPAHASAEEQAVEHTPHPPMLIVASVEDDGMGLLNWWV